MRPKYDKETLNQLKDIGQDNKLKALEDEVKALQELHSHKEVDTKKVLSNCLQRIKILEEVRVVQRGLNTTFDKDIQKLKKFKPKSLLELLFKK